MTKTLSSKEVRQLFLDFFESKGHMIEPGAPLVPVNDDTLLWINSGVAALKRYFDGSVKPKNPRIVNVQKSLRTNDIDNVGRTARHHTFFEMMGNFSIGDYFKEEAIAFAYEFLFDEKWLGLDVEKAYFSVHTTDDVAFNFWVNNHNIDPARILRTDDNYWMIGNGPSGPNSEIFIDRGESYDPDNIGERLFFEEIDNERYVEIWNIVFSQYDAVEGQPISTFKELPQKNIDTGMGFERLMSIIQNTPTNYESDLFMPLLNEIQTMTSVTYEENPMAYRVIADHARSLVFTLADGAVFSNEGRGYVLRRILRRAVRFGKVLGIEGTFIHKLVDVVIDTMGEFYGYLESREGMVKQLIEQEEKRFAKTLVGGERLLLESIESAQGKLLSGDVAFKLYDTYGFPIELTREIAEEHEMRVDMDGFQNELEAQRERARSSRTKTESMHSQQEDIMNFKETSTFRYDVDALETTVIGLFKDGKSVDTLTQEGLVIFKETPFYAESGGQIFDIGHLDSDEASGDITNVQKANQGQNLHTVSIDGVLKVGDKVSLSIDNARRFKIRKNHSAVHLLQAALQMTLGDHVTQAGSFVSDEYLRFDFSHFERVNSDAIQKIETMINTWIFEGLPIVTEEMDLEAAKETGAMALFSENYGDRVRVVSMGEISKELCGGTHASNTSELGLFTISSEESVGSGVRRIVAKTSEGAYDVLHGIQTEVADIRDTFKVAPQKSLRQHIEDMNEEFNALKQQYQALLDVSIDSQASAYEREAVAMSDGLNLVWIDVEKFDNDSLKKLVEKTREKVAIVIASNRNNDSVSFVVGASDAAIKLGYKAGDIAKEAAQITGGNGGGRPQFAQAGGKSIEKLPEAKEQIMNKLGVAL